MTQTPRDWQKDMETTKKIRSGGNGKYAPAGWLDALEYWLQEAKTLQDKLKELVEIIEYEADLADLRGAETHARELRAMVSTLYPDTPAPKEGE